MPLTTTTKVFAISDAKIGKITADAAGGSTTYATLIDVPGVHNMEVDGDIASKELRGDNVSLDYNVVLGKLTVKVEHAKVSVDVLPVLLGGTTTAAGTTPNQTQTFGLTNAAVPNYFKLEGKTPTGGADPVGGDVHVVLYKCIINGFPSIGFAEEDYRIVSFTAVAVPRLSDGKVLDFVLNETATAIS